MKHHFILIASRDCPSCPLQLPSPGLNVYLKGFHHLTICRCDARLSEMNYRWARSTTRRPSSPNTGYWRRHFRSQGLRVDRAFMHNDIVAHVPPHMTADHINRNGCDNRRCNLRVVTVAQNVQNRVMPVGACQYHHVSFDRRLRRFRARAAQDGKRISLGLFDTAIAAAKAADRFIVATGSFAPLNFPEERPALCASLKKAALWG